MDASTPQSLREKKILHRVYEYVRNLKQEKKGGENAPESFQKKNQVKNPIEI